MYSGFYNDDGYLGGWCMVDFYNDDGNLGEWCTEDFMMMVGIWVGDVLGILWIWWEFGVGDV